LGLQPNLLIHIQFTGNNEQLINAQPSLSNIITQNTLLTNNSPEIISNINTNTNSAVYSTMQLLTNPNIHLQLPWIDSNNLRESNQIVTNLITNHIPTNNLYIADNNNLKNNIPLSEFHIINEPGENNLSS
jgi:hypothetical protein